MQSIDPCLWFDTEAEEAMNFYCSVFRSSKKGQVTHYGDNMPMPKGTVLTATFEINGQKFMALNGGPDFKFTEAISLMVNCETQAEIDYYWEKLGDGGTTQQCGWLKDKYGLSWQIAPAILPELMSDPAKTNRVMAAVMQMVKLDIATMEKAAKG